MDPQGQVAVVSGGASGLGEAVVRDLVAGGAHVGILDLPSSRGAALAEELGDQTRFLPADVTDDVGVGHALDELGEAGPVRVAVNCAGIHPPATVIASEAASARIWFSQVVGVNLYGTFNLCHQIARRLVKEPTIGEERGVLVATSSVAAFDGQVGQVAYAASKAGVVGMMLPLARELARHAIRVVGIAPGLFRTPLVDDLDDDQLRSWARDVPHPQRWGRPDEFAQLARHAIENLMLNGETIRLDGAARMPPVSGR